MAKRTTAKTTPVTSLRVIGKTYKVRLAPSDEMGNKFGECDKNRLTIRLEKGMPADIYADTILHEVLHALWSAYNLPARDEEEAVNALSSGLLAVLVDNGEALPNFMRGGDG